MRTTIAAALILLSGCSGMGPAPATPKTAAESIEAAALLLNKIDAAVLDMTCTKFEKKRCIEPGKPIMPDKALSIYQQLGTAANALDASKLISIDGVGDCLGKTTSQAACLNVANSILTQLDAYLISQQRGK